MNCYVEHHSFAHLCERATGFLYNVITRYEQRSFQALENNSHTTDIINLKVFNHIKAFYVIGMLSSFEAEYQEDYKDLRGIKEKIKEKNPILAEQLSIFMYAINVLKHGKGDSYEKLLTKKDLPFTIKRNCDFFDEGDVSEINTLIQVDETFLLNCTNLITEISSLLYK